MGLQARLMGKGVRKCTGAIAKSKVVCLWVNQLRDTIGGYGPSESTPGGRALKFGASVRLDIRRSGKLIREGEEYGTKITVRTVKNKMACPFKKTDVKLIYGEGFSKEESLIDAALDLGVIVQSGSWYGFGGDNVQGTEPIRERMKKEEEYCKKVEEAVKEAMSGKKVIEISEEEAKQLTAPDPEPEEEKCEATT